MLNVKCYVAQSCEIRTGEMQNASSSSIVTQPPASVFVGPSDASQLQVVWKHSTRSCWCSSTVLQRHCWSSSVLTMFHLLINHCSSLGPFCKKKRSKFPQVGEEMTDLKDVGGCLLHYEVKLMSITVNVVSVCVNVPSAAVLWWLLSAPS